jgi:hypothetical protein
MDAWVQSKNERHHCNQIAPELVMPGEIVELVMGSGGLYDFAAINRSAVRRMLPTQHQFGFKDGPGPNDRESACGFDQLLAALTDRDSWEPSYSLPCAQLGKRFGRYDYFYANSKMIRDGDKIASLNSYNRGLQAN